MPTPVPRSTAATKAKKGAVKAATAASSRLRKRPLAQQPGCWRSSRWCSCVVGAGVVPSASSRHPLTRSRSVVLHRHRRDGSTRTGAEVLRRLAPLPHRVLLPARHRAPALPRAGPPARPALACDPRHRAVAEVLGAHPRNARRAPPRHHHPAVGGAASRSRRSRAPRRGRGNRRRLNPRRFSPVAIITRSAGARHDAGRGTGTTSSRATCGTTPLRVSTSTRTPSPSSTRASPGSGPALKPLTSSASRSTTVTTRTSSARSRWALSTRSRPSSPSMVV